MTEITGLNPVDDLNTAITGSGITGSDFVSKFDNATRSLLGLLGRLNSGAAPIADTFTLADPADLTKRFRFDGGLVTAGQTRIITVPDWNLTLKSAPVTKTGDFTVAETEIYLINNKSGSACTVTLPAAASYPGRELTLKTVQAQTTISATSNVVPLAGGAAGTAILSANAGRWAKLVSDGTSWVIMAGVV